MLYKLTQEDTLMPRQAQQDVIAHILNDPKRGFGNYAQGQLFLAISAVEPLLKMWEGQYLSDPNNLRTDAFNENNRLSKKLDSWCCSTYISARKGRISNIISYVHDLKEPLVVQARGNSSKESLQNIICRIKKLVSFASLKPYIKVTELITILFNVVNTTNVFGDPSEQKSILFGDLKRFPAQHTLYLNHHFFNVLAAIIGWDQPKPAEAALRILLFDISIQRGIKGFLAEVKKILNTNGEAYYHGLLINDKSRDQLKTCCLQGAIKAARSIGVKQPMLEEALTNHHIHFEEGSPVKGEDRRKSYQNTFAVTAKALFKNLRPLSTQATLDFVLDIHKMVEVPSRYQRQKLWLIGSVFSLALGTTLTCIVIPTLLSAIPNISAGALYSALACLMLITALLAGFCAAKAIKNEPSKKLLSRLALSKTTPLAITEGKSLLTL